MLLQFTGKRLDLCASLRKIVVPAQYALREIGDPIRIGGTACGDPLQFHGTCIRVRTRLANLRIQRVSLIDARRVFRVHAFESRSLAVDQFAETGDLRRGCRLFGVHLRQPARQHHAKLAAQFIAERAITFRLGRLALEHTHLPRDLFEDVVHARQILFRRLQPQLRKALLRLEACDARRFFDDGAAIQRLGRKNASNALLADHGIALAAQAGTHEDVLDIPQAADLAIQQILGVAGAEQAARDRDLAGANGGASELAAANLENHIVAGCQFGVSFGRLSQRSLPRPCFTGTSASIRCAWLRIRHSLFCLHGRFGAKRRLVPVTAAS